LQLKATQAAALSILGGSPLKRYSGTLHWFPRKHYESENHNLAVLPKHHQDRI
jgi:hypothetical protein